MERGENMLKKVTIFMFIALMLAIFASITDGKEIKNTITLSSPAFEYGEYIPSIYTCMGKDISPPLRWNGVPPETECIVLICDDPDAPMGTWVHWVIYNIPPDSKGLPEGVPRIKRLKDGSLQGLNDFRKIGYGGPCPPGGVHRYFFKIYAVDKMLKIGPGASKRKVLELIKGHIISKGELMGKFRR